MSTNFSTPTSVPLQLMLGKTICSTPTAAREMVRRLASLNASSKMSSPLCPGWYVWLTADNVGPTVYWRLLAEPEADVQTDAPPF